MDRENILESIGLSKNESKVYVALLELGPSSVTKISEKSKIHRTNVYDSLEKLREKGLVSYILQDETKIFQTNDPKVLLTMIKEKEAILTEILPQLNLSKQLAQQSEFAQIHTGVRAIQNILMGFLEIGLPRLSYGTPAQASQILGPFIERYHKQRIAKKLLMKMIYNSDAKDRIKYLNAMPYTESRYLAPEYDAPAQTNICGDEVDIIVWSKNPVCIQIKNTDVARAYHNYFEILWKMARKE